MGGLVQIVFSFSLFSLSGGLVIFLERSIFSISQNPGAGQVLLSSISRFIKMQKGAAALVVNSRVAAPF